MQLVTARLQLDGLRADDAPALFAYRANPMVACFQGWRPASVAEAGEFIRRQAGASLEVPDRWLQRAIRLRDSGELIGDLGIHWPAEANGSVEFGISVAPARQRQGYAREALHALFTMLFDRLGRHRIHASVDPRNLASMAMLRSLGMRQEAHHRESLWLGEQWVDDVIFAILDHEWQAQSRVG